jgi:hypothetical protein
VPRRLTRSCCSTAAGGGLPRAAARRVVGFQRCVARARLARGGVWGDGGHLCVVLAAAVCRCCHARVTALCAFPRPRSCPAPPGLGCRVHNAVLRTDDSGRASDVFWVTDLRGRKVGRGRWWAAGALCCPVHPHTQRLHAVTAPAHAPATPAPARSCLTALRPTRLSAWRSLCPTAHRPAAATSSGCARLCVCVYVCVCVRACVRACACVCARRVRVHARAVCVWGVFWLPLAACVGAATCSHAACAQRPWAPARAAAHRPPCHCRAQEFACGDIAITNLAHPRFTQVTISADLFSPGACVGACAASRGCARAWLGEGRARAAVCGRHHLLVSRSAHQRTVTCVRHSRAACARAGLLLELSSIIHGQGLSVVEGVIRGGR